jgi:Flp pilus assembly protein CpaB
MPRFRRPVSALHLLRQVVAVGLLALALVLALRPESAPAGNARAPTVPVVVAAGDLPAGTPLTEADLAVARLPPDLRPDGSVTEVEPILGRVLAAPVRNGEAITDVRLVGSGVTALLPSGHVAAPVRLADLAVAALVRSGDRIDVLAIVEGGSAADVVAENALVLAATGSGGAETDDGSAGLLLVAVPPEVAARLAAAAATATLTITLPPP